MKRPRPLPRLGSPQEFCRVCPHQCGHTTWPEGYLVQNAVHQILAETEWGPVVGYKIGCTTSVMQQYLNITHPCAGGLFSGRIHQGRANLNHGSYVRPGIECEIAVRLGR